MQCVDAKAEAMRQQSETAALVVDRQIVPESRIINKWQIRFSFRMTLEDQFCHHANLQVGRLRGHVDVTH